MDARQTIGVENLEGTSKCEAPQCDLAPIFSADENQRISANIIQDPYPRKSGKAADVLAGERVEAGARLGH